ncbi:MAG: hypothetical protein VB081_02930 [Christensenella sp.]|uniref:hypothetical protein n=1 Tax=Christensenella sp. TaxID=1935934 RepID=UPI002B205D75|nr:hypothetical protein [Christensenella sp.]MEA5002429.1 hypothetical protein [Christensenella sp.]
MKEKDKEVCTAQKREALRKLDEKMQVFAEEREKLNKMSAQRIALGKPLTDGDILLQNERCSDMSLDIMKLQEYLDEIEDE